jgi:hypothetical protein
MKKRTHEAAAYSVKSIDGGWEVFDQSGRRLSQEPQAKNDAVIHAKELARRDGAQILIYDEHGKLESEFFYQQEERASLAHDDSVRSMAASEPVIHRRR